MATLAFDNDEIYEQVALVCQLRRDFANWTTQETNDVDRIIRAARRKFFSAYPWNFLVQNVSLSIEAPVELDVDVADGVCTVNSGTLPTLPTSYRAVFSSVSGVYEIDSFNAGTDFTLYDTTIDGLTAETVKLYRTNYALPTNFASFESPVTIENNREIRQLGAIPDYVTNSALNFNIPVIRRPEVVSVTSTPNSETGVPVHTLNVWPLPDKLYVGTMRVRIFPGDALAEVGDVGSPVYGEALMACVLATADLLYNDNKGVYDENYKELLAQAIATDKRAKGTRFLKDPNRRRPLPYYFDIAAQPGTSNIDLGGF